MAQNLLDVAIDEHDRASAAFDMLPTREEVDNATDNNTSISEEAENLTTFRNAVVVGVMINDQDSIPSIDMNEISHQDPYVFGISSAYTLFTNQDQEYEEVN